MVVVCNCTKVFMKPSASHVPPLFLLHMVYACEGVSLALHLLLLLSHTIHQSEIRSAGYVLLNIDVR